MFKYSKIIVIAFYSKCTV